MGGHKKNHSEMEKKWKCYQRPIDPFTTHMIK